MKKNNKNSRKLIRQVFFSVLPIQIASGFILYLHSLVDSVLVGRYLGEAELAIIGLAVPIALTITLTGCVISTGAQILCGNAMGRGDGNGVQASFGNAVMLSSLFGIVWMLLCMALSGNIPGWLGVEDAETAEQFTEYLKGMSIGFPFTVFFQTQLSFLELDRQGRFAAISTVVLIATKILSDVLSVFVFKNGMFGIGLATSIAYFAAVSVGAVSFILKCKSFRFKIKSISFKTSFEMITKGLPGGLQTLSSIFITTLLNTLVMNYGGQERIAVLTVAMNTTELFFSCITASFTTASVLISVFAGSRDTTSIKKICATAIQTGWVLSAISVVLMFLFSDQFALLFGLGEESAPLASHAMRCMMLAGFVCWGKLLPLSAYKSMGMVKRASIFCVIGFFAIPFVASIILTLLLGLEGVWFIYVGGDIISMTSFFIYYSIKRKRLPGSMEEWIYIPQEFGAPDEQRLDITLKSVEDAVSISEKVVEFCREKGIDRRRGYFSGLCVEEMATNIFIHNQTNAGNITADLRVTEQNGELFISLRDNGMKFDPKEYLALTEGNDPASNIGIKIVASLAKEIQYAAPLGLNLLTIRM